MAKEVWTVLFDVKDAGGLAPAVWAEKKLKVQNAAAETKEKNASGPLVAAGANIKSAEPQEAKIVSIEAESAEEAILAVQKFYSQGGSVAAEAGQLENTKSEYGPRIDNFANHNKWAAVATGNLTEVTVR